MKSILKEKNLKGKKILLRLDLNVPLENGKISDTTRIDKILPTLNFLIQQKTKIIILSHVGRPKGKTVKELSKEFPNYGWKQNKGYPTKKHRLAISKYGVTKYHRKSFSLTKT